MSPRFLFIFVSFACCPLISAADPGEPLRLEVTRDLWISSYKTEREGNNGASPKLKLKGIQEFFLIDLDPAALRGKRVTRAELHVHLEGPERLGRITVSTVAEEWVEGAGTSYVKTPGASAFAWARTDQARWAGGKEPDITGVIHGIGGSIWGFGDASPPDADQWQVIPVSPDVVQARVDGLSYGFCVMDDVGSEYTRHGNTIEYRNFPNRYVSSREAGKKRAPYFTIWTTDAPAPAPQRERNEHVESASTSGDLPPLPKLGAASSTKPPVPCRDEYGEPLERLDFFAARGETVGLIVEGDVNAVEAPGLQVTLFSLPTVGGVVDPVVPRGFTGAPVEANAASGGTYVELSVPKGCDAGRRAGLIEVGGQSVPFSLTVWNFTLPDRLSFIPEMNCYGLPKEARAYYRLAHEHRTTLNQVPYGWTGKVKAAPAIKADGSWDWTAWDAEYGPLLDGSAFADLPRGAVPVDAFYLPLNENWPMDHEKHFRGGYWIEDAYDGAYWEEFRAAAGRFAEHFATKGWNEPMFEFYLNNKVYFKAERDHRWDACFAPWIFDEPMNTQDFWALRRFGLEYWRGVASHPAARMAFRADISRPEWQRDLLDGLTSVEVVSGALRTYRDRVIDRAHRCGNLVYMYGAANPIGTSNTMSAAWCVETWALGADGVVPWQTIGTPNAWQKPDHLSLLYPTPNGPVPSLRLKAFRAGQQLVEYLTMYTALSQQDRGAIGAAVLQLPALRATLQKKSEADAGTPVFGPAAHESLLSLRWRLGNWLDAKAPPARERWHDPRPARRDPGKVREITALRPSP